MQPMQSETISLIWTSTPIYPGLYLARDPEGILTAIEVTYGTGDRLECWQLGMEEILPIERLVGYTWALIPRRAA
jgi:hypothetical protein